MNRKHRLCKEYLQNGHKNQVLLLLFSFVIMGFLQGCKKDLTSLVKDPGTDSTVVEAKPNIVLILAEDVGFEVTHYTGGDSYNTQNLNYMAKSGVQFRQAYSHPDNFPSRLAALTGKYNFRNYTVWGQIAAGNKTIGNMMQDAGYRTCYVGRWEGDGGDAGIHNAGFQDYRVFLPFLTDNPKIGKYKSPVLYEHGNYLASSVTKDKFSEDLFVDYLSNFIDDNKTNKTPFFAVYSMVLANDPWVPTPDDPAFPGWDPSTDYTKSDSKYFPGMVKYMDEMVGRVYNKINSDGFKSNTVIMYATTAATNRQIASVYKGDSVLGGKNLTTTQGTHTPLLLYWPGKIPLKQKNTTTLIDFTDFLPSIADIAGIPVPTTYGTLDGVSFYDNLFLKPGKDRDWIFCHWDNDPADSKPPVRYVNNLRYKLYDTPDYSNFFQIISDPNEKQPYPDELLSPEEMAIKQNFEQVLQEMH